MLEVAKNINEFFESKPMPIKELEQNVVLIHWRITSSIATLNKTHDDLLLEK